MSRLKLRYVIIGGLAVIVNGYDRATRDVDAIVWDADECFDEFMQVLAEEGLTLREGDLAFVRRYRVARLKTAGETEVDISLGLLPFEHEAVDRAKQTELSTELHVPIATPEDLVIMKLIASRDRDIDDCRRLLELDHSIQKSRVLRWVREFAEVSDDGGLILANLDSVFARHR
jgi:hypothetical protein